MNDDIFNIIGKMSDNIEVIQLHTFLQLNKNDIKNYLKYTYVILSKNLVPLINKFIIFKQKYGSLVEQTIYRDMTIQKFITRLIKKRAVTFSGQVDRYTLRNGLKGFGSWQMIGTDYQQTPLIMNDYLTYDELEINAFLGTSIYTPFLNQGQFRNNGLPGSDFERNGIIIYQPGIRIHSINYMEWKFIIVDPVQNTLENGYGPNNKTIKGHYMDLWAKFYDVQYFPLYEEVLSYTDHRYIKLENFKDIFLDTLLLQKRIRYNVLLFLKEANIRAYAINKYAFCYIDTKSFDLSNAIFDYIHKEYINTIKSIISTRNYKNISNIYFSTNTPNEILNEKIGHIQVEVGTRNPFTSLRDDSRILIANVGTNSNSYPGNEIFEHISSGSNIATGSYTSIIGNPEINRLLSYYIY